MRAEDQKIRRSEDRKEGGQEIMNEGTVNKETTSSNFFGSEGINASSLNRAGNSLSRALNTLVILFVNSVEHIFRNEIELEPEELECLINAYCMLRMEIMGSGKR